MKIWYVWLLFGSSLLFLIFGIRHYVGTSNLRDSYLHRLELIKNHYDYEMKLKQEYFSQDSLLLTQLIEVGRNKNKTIVNYDARRIYEALIKAKKELPAYEEFITKEYTWSQLEELFFRMDDDIVIVQNYDKTFSQFLGELYAFKSFEVQYFSDQQFSV